MFYKTWSRTLIIHGSYNLISPMTLNHGYHVKKNLGLNSREEVLSDGITLDFRPHRGDLYYLLKMWSNQTVLDHISLIRAGGTRQH